MKKLLVIGGGNMGAALIGALVNQQVMLPEQISLLESNEDKANMLQEKYKIELGNPGDADVILLAVKPQSLSSVFPIKTAEAPLLISVLAGTPVGALQAASGIGSICRAMPNTPALVGKGISGIYFSPMAMASQKTFCREFFTAAGKYVEVAEEDDLHAVTAISGSGPAYFFAMVEHLASAGQELGLSKETATTLAKETCIGAAELIHQSSDNPATLRARVTSKGGTTAAALDTFSKKKFDQIVLAAAKAAHKRSQELAQ